MHLLLTILPITIAGLLVLYLPGASLLGATRLGRVVPAPMLPTAAMVMSLVPLTIITSITLLLHTRIWTITLGLGLVTLAAWLVQIKRDGLRGPLRALLTSPVWSTPWGAWIAALATGLLALSVGYFAWNDSAYHIAQAQKLLHLAHPTFSNTLQFPNGTAHPGYLIPLWQEVLAQVAFVAHADPMEVAWVLPLLTVAAEALAVGALLGTLMRTRRAVTPGVVAWGLVAAAGPLPTSDAIYNSMHPGTITLTAFIPFIVTMLFVGCWPERGERGELLRGTAQLSPKAVTAGAAILVGLATAVSGILHVSNLVLLAIALFGYLVLFAVRAPWSKGIVLHHLTMFATIGVVAVCVVGSLYPGLSKLQSFGKSAAAELQANDSDLYVGKNSAPLPALLKGDVHGNHYHLRADYLVLGGGMSVLAVFCMAGALLLSRRWPGAWYLGGTALLVLGIALTDWLYPHFVDVVSLDQGRRIEQSLPLEAAFGAGAVGVAAVARWLMRLGRAGWIAAGALTAGSIAGIWSMVNAIGVLGGYAGKQTVDPHVLLAALALLLVGGIGALVLRGRVEQRLHLPTWRWPTLGPGVGVLATAIMLIGAWPVHARVQDMWPHDRLQVQRGSGTDATTVQLPTWQRLGELRVFSIQVARQLRALPVGSMVIADPRTRESYLAQAIAPVYVVSSVPRHTANTPGNHVEQRYHLAESFFDSTNGKSDEQRLRILLDQKVDAIIANPRSSVRAMLNATPGLKRVAYGKNQFLWTVDRKRLAAYLKHNAHAAGEPVDVIVE